MFTKKIARKNWKTITIYTLIIGVMGCFIYITFLEEIINNYQKSQIPYRMEKNLSKNKEEFKKLIELTKEFSYVSEIASNQNNYIRFQIRDPLLNTLTKKTDSINYIRLGYDNFSSLINNRLHQTTDINFMANDSISLVPTYEISPLKNWVITYEGKIDDPILKKLLKYSKISPDQLNLLLEKLKKVDCFEVQKNNNFISLSYAGHQFVNFNYKIPILETYQDSTWNFIEKGYYWEFYDCGLYCAQTNW